MKEIIKRLESKIEDIRRIGQDMDEAGWGTEEGVLITGNEAQKILDFIGAESGQINADVIRRTLEDRITFYEKEIKEYSELCWYEKAGRLTVLTEGYKGALNILKLNGLI